MTNLQEKGRPVSAKTKATAPGKHISIIHKNYLGVNTKFISLRPVKPDPLRQEVERRTGKLTDWVYAYLAANAKRALDNEGWPYSEITLAWKMANIYEKDPTLRYLREVEI